MTSDLTTLAFGMPGPWEWLVIGILGVLIFGKRLPEVGRSIGKGIVEFKKGLAGIDDDIDTATKTSKKLDDPATRNSGNVNTESAQAEASQTKASA